jgi:kexin
LEGNPYSIHPTALWQQSITGNGVQIAIVDDGLQHNNPDLKVHIFLSPFRRSLFLRAPDAELLFLFSRSAFPPPPPRPSPPPHNQSNYNADGSYDFNYHNSSPDPSSRDHHGTESAGVAGAASNSVCGVGVAPEARLAGVKLLARVTSDADEASALSYKSQLNMIYSNSWGPSDSGTVVEGPGSLLQRAFKQVTSEGRGGLGGVYVWAGGNGRGSGDNCNCDGYVNSVYTLPVGAYTDRGTQASYSESCSALFASMPSSGGRHGITTTDLMSSSSTCTGSFGGTSAAAPMASGAVALMLQVCCVRV